MWVRLCQVCDRGLVWTSLPALGSQGRTRSHNGGRQTLSGMARSAPIKADPKLPKDQPALMAVYPPAEKSCMQQPIPGGQGGPAEIPSGHTCSG